MVGDTKSNAMSGLPWAREESAYIYDAYIESTYIWRFVDIHGNDDLYLFSTSRLSKTHMEETNTSFMLDDETI